MTESNQLGANPATRAAGAKNHSPLTTHHSPLTTHNSLLTLNSSQATAIVALTAVFVLLSLQPVWHTDVWGHLRFGEYIVEQRRLPEHEMFSRDFADQDAAYINFQWLAQAGAYLVYEFGSRLAGGGPEQRLAGGALMLSTAHAMLVTLRLVVLLVAFRRLTGSLWFGLIGCGLALGMGLLVHISIHRPQVLGELGFALVLLALSRPLLTSRAVILVPLVLAVWANCHGSFPMGFVLLGAFAVGRAIEVASGHWLGARAAKASRSLAANLRLLATALVHDPQLRRLLLTLALGLAAVALLNPHGPRLFLYSYELSRHPNIPYMDEWKPLPVKSLSGYAFLFSFFLLAPLVRFSPVRFSPTQVILLAGFGQQSLAHARVLVWWTVIVVWVALPHLQAVWLRYQPKAPAGTDLRTGWKTLLAALAVLLLLPLSSPGQWLWTRRVPAIAQRVTAVTPWEASAFLKKEYVKNPHLKRCVFTSETMGDYLLWDLRLDPPVHVFCYTHVHLFREDHWKDCLAVKFGDRRWQAILDANGVQFLVVERIPLYEPLIEQVEAADNSWKVIPLESPVFLAKRKD